MLNMQQSDKFTLTIDGNWFLISRLQSLLASNPDCNFYPETFERSRRRLLDFLCTSLAKELRDLSQIVDDCIIVSDWKAWRKEHQYLVRPGDTVDGDNQLYKAHRQSDSSIDMSKVFEIYVEWLAKMHDEFNIRHVRFKGFEGDDTIYFLSDELLSRGKSVLYMSTDKDLIQLNRVHETTNAVSVFYRKKKQKLNGSMTQTNVLTTTREVHERLKVLANSSFDPLSPLAQGSPAGALLDWIDEVEYDRVPVYLLYKIMCGDAGDGVPMLITRPAGQRLFKTSHKHIEPALSDTMLDHESMTISMLYRKEFIEHMLKSVYKYLYRSKHNPNPEISSSDLEWYTKRWEENRKLMRLHHSEIPQELVFEWSAFTEGDAHVKLIDVQTAWPDRNELLQAFSMISDDSAMSLHEQELLKQNSVEPIGPAKAISGEVQEFDIDAMM